MTVILKSSHEIQGQIQLNNSLKICLKKKEKKMRYSSVCPDFNYLGDQDSSLTEARIRPS